MTSESKFRLFSVIVLATAFVSIAATANKEKTQPSDLMATHLRLLEEASMINNDTLSPSNLTQIGQLRDSTTLTK